MTLTFTHSGREITLHKHPVATARHGTDAAGLALTPWYLTVYHGGRRVVRSLGTARDADAIREAKARLRLVAGSDTRTVESFLAHSTRRAALTLDTLSREWVAAGMPRPNGARRTPIAQWRIQGFLGPSLRYWGNRAAEAIKPTDFAAFAAWKRSNAPAGATGERAADLELVALSNLCAWAVAAGHITRNPFTERPRFRESAAVEHHADHAPTSDEDLHRVLGWLLHHEEPGRVVAGAQLMFCALTGLRPGEPGALQRRQATGMEEFPGATITLPAADGASPAQVMVVHREKKGLNPAVSIHPALDSFLHSWRQWLAVNVPTSAWLFPDPAHPSEPLVVVGNSNRSRLREHLNAAQAAVGLDDAGWTPHSMRAFYVSVRREQGALDATIASELGQSGGARLIEAIYGRRSQIRGLGRLDWLPAAPAVPCWQHLVEQPTSNIIAL
jgi:integrase